jgi:hypothetical protein
MSKKDNWTFYAEDWNEENIPIRKIKRIKNDIKRNKAKDNRSRAQGSGATD